MSIAEAPVVAFAEALHQSGVLGGRTIFVCVDEYENLLDYQQAIVNTYIKHAEPPISYKVGVRQKGLRTRHTIEGGDLLSTPDDYRQIDIAEEGFPEFADKVVSRRLQRARELGVNVPEDLGSFLRYLPTAAEAELLGASRVASQVRRELAADDTVQSYFADVADTDLYFLAYWADSEDKPTMDLARDWMANPARWKHRLNNYGYSSLFWLSNGRKGARIRKYYCGKRVFLTLAGGNIRYFLELVDASISEQLRDYSGPDAELILSPKAQTLAARFVGQRRLRQLSGLAQDGVKLKRLVLAIGKVFFELARAPLGRTPEVTSFVVSGDEKARSDIQWLLDEGVAHLALQASPRTKATSPAEMKEDEYRLHPIFCAFFEISHRRKRRMTFEAERLLDVLGDKPAYAISSMLDGREQTETEALPAQLAFFSTFYGAKSGD